MTLTDLERFCHSPRERKAIAFLEHPESYPGLAPWEESQTTVTFLRLPSFQPHSLWTLQHRENISQVRRIEWDHIADRELAGALPDSDPITFGADAQLPAADAQQVLDELASISLPPFLPLNTFGLDGVSFAIKFGDSWRSAHLHWWSDPPAEWQPLACCFDRAVALFDTHLPASTAHDKCT